MSLAQVAAAISKNVRYSTLTTVLPKITLLEKNKTETGSGSVFVKFIKQEDLQTLKQSFENSNPYMRMSLNQFEGKQHSVCMLNCPVKDDWNKAIDSNYHEQTLLVSLGDKKQITLDSIQSSLYSSMVYLQNNKVKNATYELPIINSIDIGHNIKRFVTTSLLSNYQRNFMYSDPTKQKSILETISLHIPSSIFSTTNQDYITKYFNLGKQLGYGTCLARDIANLHTDCYGPDVLSSICKEIANDCQLDFTVLDSDQLQSIGCNLLYSVGKGSVSKSRLVLLKYNGASDPSLPYTALVGKGITFDTGGLNLKPDNYIDNMNLDKGGAAAVIGTLYNISKLHINRNVIGVVPLAENAIGPESFKPTSVLTAYNKKTVEVKNTDAEGRLILADSLAYVTKNFSVNKAIDICTLTGACCVALGEYMAGLFSNSDALSSSIIKAGDNVFERCWRLPILPEHTEEIKASSVADLQSMGAGRYGGACTAAAFLKEFVPPDCQWAHLDIAGPGMYSKEREFMCINGTGFGTQLLTQYLLNDTHY